MANFLTDGRLAMVGALRDDTEIARRVRTWFDFGPGLQRRYSLEPALCPALSVSPAEGTQAAVANVERETVQTLRVEAATDGQDVAPCEELAALILARVEACNEECLGLASDGLTGLRVRSVAWASRPRQDGARLIWTASIQVELLWRRI
jgi:hypothetical protein